MRYLAHLKIMLMGTRFLPFIIFSGLLSASPTPVQAQDVSAQTSHEHLAVNGAEIKGQILESDGKHFVAVEDLAIALGGTLSYSEGSIVLVVLPVSGKDHSPSQLGSIKGTLTFYFNSNYGDKPDVGSPVLLVRGHAEFSEQSVFVPIAGKDGVLLKTQYEVLRTTIADGNGNFGFSDLPAGEYTVVAQSKHVNGLNQRDIMGKVRYFDVQVKAGVITDSSIDFGPKTAP